MQLTTTVKKTKAALDKCSSDADATKNHCRQLAGKGWPEAALKWLHDQVGVFMAEVQVNNDAYAKLVSEAAFTEVIDVMTQATADMEAIMATIENDAANFRKGVFNDVKKLTG